jgi:hypothetical protein
MERRRRHIFVVCVPCAGRCAFGAPSRRFWASGRAFREPVARLSVSELLAGGLALLHRLLMQQAASLTLPPGGVPGPPGDTAASHASGRHIPLHFKTPLEAPLDEQDTPNVMPRRRAGIKIFCDLEMIGEFAAPSARRGTRRNYFGTFTLNSIAV